MRRRKTYPITDVASLARPDLIWNYNRDTGSGPLHISDKSCKQGQDRKELTRCGRAMYPDFHTWNMRDRTVADFQQCKRCGSPEEFAQAYAEHQAWGKAREEQRQQEQAQQQQVREQERELRIVRVKKLASFLVAVGLRVGVKDGTAAVEFDGYEYTVTEAGPAPERDAETQ